MDHLWSPWRLAYVTGTPTTDECVFCDAADAMRIDGEEHPLVVARGRGVFVILNLYPYNNGHLMVVPDRHVASLTAFRDDELNELMRFIRETELALIEAYQPQGINVGINLGRSAGAGIADHVHVHLVPRWTGDTNFMSVIGETRVLPEDLATTALRLRAIFKRQLAQD